MAPDIDKNNPTNYMNNMTSADSTETQIQPRDVAPNATPAAPAPAAPAASAPAAPAAQPSTATVEPPSDPHKVRRDIFGAILRTLSGAPQYVTQTDPETGETTRVPIQQTRGQLGKSILAGALAGMFGGMDARDPEGRHDPAAAASQGFKAGAEFHDKQQAAAQKFSDEQLARKQMTMKSNLDTAHLTLALNQGKQNMYEKIVANNQNGILKDAMAYDQSLTDQTQPKAILRQNLSHDEALAALKGHWSDQLAQIDGYRQTENGDIVPTYTLLNPEVKVKMSDAAAKEFARFNPQFQTAWDNTSGNIQMGLHQYATAQNSLNSLEHMDAIFSQVDAALGLKKPDFANAVRAIGPTGMKAVIEAENAIGGGGTPVDALRRLALSSGGAQILNHLGITGEKVEKLYNDQQAAEAHAKGASREEIEANKLAEKEKLDELKETRKKKNTMGYVEDMQGRLQHVSQYDVENNPEKYSAQTFHEVKPSDVAKDTKLVKPLGDVQMNLNHYRTAANNYTVAQMKGAIAPAKVASDKVNLNTIVSDTAVSDAAAHAGAGGFGISIPTMSLNLEAQKKQKLMDAYNALSPEGKMLADNYARARAAIPAWVKALTESGRGSKEQLEIELQNLLPPAYEIADIHNRLDGFQSNLDNQKSSIPQNLLGTRMPSPVLRADKPPQGATGLVRNPQGEVVGYIVNGRPVDGNGDPLQGR
jgi:hypothetical protein